MILDFLPLTTPAMHDTLTEQNVAFVTIAEGLHYCNNVEENSCGRMGREQGEVEGKITVPKKLYHRKQW